MLTPLKDPNPLQTDSFGILQMDSLICADNSTANNLIEVQKVDQIIEEMVKRAEYSQNSQTSLVPEKPASDEDFNLEQLA